MPSLPAEPLRVVVADDERPARLLLIDRLEACGGVTVVGAAQHGEEAVELIARERPDLALLDLQMPALSGIGVVRALGAGRLPLVAFVTAHEDYAVDAFAVDALDYLLKPVAADRLQATLDRARERLAVRPAAIAGTAFAEASAAAGLAATPLRRIPVRRRDDFYLVPVAQLASAVAEGELVHLTTRTGERYSIWYRLKDLEARLDPARFLRVERGALVSIDAIQRISALPGGSYLLALSNGQEIRASRVQSRLLRERLLRL
jgi:two-component system, LytTR family, response regulator